MVGTALFIGEHAHFATGISRVCYLRSGYSTKLVAFQWDRACTHSLPGFYFCRSGWVWLVRLPYTNGLWLINIPADLSGYFHVGARNKNSREIPRCLLLGHDGGYTVVYCTKTCSK